MYRLVVRDGAGRTHTETGSLTRLALRMDLCGFYPGQVHPATGGIARTLITSSVIEGPIEQNHDEAVDEAAKRRRLRDAASDLLAACEMNVAHQADIRDEFAELWADKGHEWARILVATRAAIRKAK